MEVHIQMKQSKYAVPVMADLIQGQWALELADKLNVSVEAISSGQLDLLSVSLKSVRIVLMDESVVDFKDSLFVVSESRRAIAVFTEHCGYHVFPYHEAKVYVDGELVYEQKNA